MAKITLDALRVLDAIEQKGSFAAAAESLHKVPSAVSYIIQQLEDSLGTALFDRRGHRALLTTAGRHVLDRGRQILYSAEQLTDEAQRIASGWEARLRILYDTIYPLPPLLERVRQFQEQHPWVKVQLLEGALSGSWETLLDNRADLLIGASGDMPAAAGIKRQPLGKIPFSYICHPGHPATKLSQPISEESLQGFTRVAINDSARYLPERTIGLTGGPASISVPNLYAKLQAHLAGLGIGYLPHHIVKPYIDSGKLVTLELEQKRPLDPLYLAWRTQNVGRGLDWFLKNLLQQPPNLDADSH